METAEEIIDEKAMVSTGKGAPDPAVALHSGGDLDRVQEILNIKTTSLKIAPFVNKVKMGFKVDTTVVLLFVTVLRFIFPQLRLKRNY